MLSLSLFYSQMSYVSTVLRLNFRMTQMCSHFCLCSTVLTDRPPPIIRQGPSNQTLGVDSVALLKCQASGDPIPSISWLKDGVSLLGKDPRMSLQELGSLQIKNIKVKDFIGLLVPVLCLFVYAVIYICVVMQHYQIQCL